MKKIFSFVFALLICFCPVLLSACGKSTDCINMSKYFKNEATYQVYGSGSKDEIKDKLSTFTDDKFDNMTQYLKITFTGESAWLYKMTIKKVSFKIYSNQTEELQFIVRFSNLKNSSIHNGEFVASVNAKANKAVEFSVDINDYVESNSSVTTVSIEIDNSMFYNADDKNTGLKIDISSFKVFGEHNLSKI